MKYFGRIWQSLNKEAKTSHTTGDKHKGQNQRLALCHSTLRAFSYTPKKGSSDNQNFLSSVMRKKGLEPSRRCQH